MLTENINLRNIGSRFKKPRYQCNEFLESDAEIIRLPNGNYLAISSDSIVEEIETGLYSDPYQIGWMLVVSNLSDLAAVGAKPLGLTIVENIPLDYPKADLLAMQKGIQDACTKHQSFILGGDTNQSKNLQLSATAIGVINEGPIINRKGISANDKMYVSSTLGLGNAFAFDHLFLKYDNVEFLPVARLNEGSILRKYASACMDTSDGFFPAICNLLELNSIGMCINRSLDEIVDISFRELAMEHQIPPWIFLAGPHGEFELLFSIPGNRETEFLKACEHINWHPLRIGKCTTQSGLQILRNNQVIKIDPFEVANLYDNCKNDLYKYLEELIKIDTKWKSI